MKTILASALIVFASTHGFAKSPPPPPTAVLTITPSSSLTRGGEIVHIHGRFLAPSFCGPAGCPNLVQFGGVLARFMDNTDEEMVVVAPPHAPGPVDVEIFVGHRAHLVIPSGYFYQEGPPDDRVRLLIPVAISAAGAMNSSWQTDVLVNNGNSEELLLDGASGASGDVAHGITPAPVLPFSSTAIALRPPPGNTGAFLYVPKRLVDNVLINVRVHDTSHDAESWGADIPVVPENQFRRSVILAPIPSDSRFRTLLRVYGYAQGNTTVLVTLRDDVSGQLLDSRNLVLRFGAAEFSTSPPGAPAYGQLSLDPIVSSLAEKHASIRAEITDTAIGLGSPLWAFVAVTNNVTEQVTTVMPAIVHAAVAIPTPDTLLVGHWGGVSSCLDVSQAEVSIAFGCGGGTFNRPTPGADHRFEVDGTVEIIVGPGVPGHGTTAHFSGVLQGTSVTVTGRSGNTVLGPFTMQLGLPGNCGHPCPAMGSALLIWSRHSWGRDVRAGARAREVRGYR